MSVEDEVELRDLVAQTLELNGCLPKIRAQLRANLFLALDEDSKICKQEPLLNPKVKSFLEVPEGQLMFCLVREFLEYFDLDFTASVYEPESYVGSYYKYEGRQKIIKDLGMKPTEDDFSGPVLLHLVKISQSKSKTLRIDLNLNGDEQKESNCSSMISHDDVNGCSDSTNKDNLDNVNARIRNEEHIKEHNVDKILNNLDQDIKENSEIQNSAYLDSTYVKNNVENDDTFNGTSSIEEESANCNENQVVNNRNSVAVDQDSSSSEMGSSPETKSKSDDKTKSSKSEKLKSKLELPPLQLNKSRGSDLLPSLYHKDFREKLNKEYDFEIKDDYEEDFLSGSELDFSRSKNESPKPLFEELQQCSGYTMNNKNINLKNKNTTNSDQQLTNSTSDNKCTKSNSSENIETNLSVDEEDSADSKKLSCIIHST